MRDSFTGNWGGCKIDDCDDLQYARSVVLGWLVG